MLDGAASTSNILRIDCDAAQAAISTETHFTKAERFIRIWTLPILRLAGNGETVKNKNTLGGLAL
ncbi:MAG: hypothetical protein JXB42_00735 [Deltaproteobacteria bacterium]|nr:hypothetical protein [Deltaproteobacteria bacterium]